MTLNLKDLLVQEFPIIIGIALLLLLTRFKYSRRKVKLEQDTTEISVYENVNPCTSITPTTSNSLLNYQYDNLVCNGISPGLLDTENLKVLAFSKSGMVGYQDIQRLPELNLECKTKKLNLITTPEDTKKIAETLTSFSKEGGLLLAYLINSNLEVSILS